jgi:guanylate kinase
MKDLRERIIGRGTENEITISHRLGVASDEYKQIHHYDYVVINDEVKNACEKIQAIVIAEHCRKDRLILSE